MKLSELKLNPDNPRLIKDDKFKKLVASLNRDPEFMETHQIGYKNGIIYAGNMRYRALLELGYTEIPDNWVVDISKWPDDKVRRYVVVDNLGYGEWDWEIMGNNYEIGELLEWGFDEKELRIEQEVVEDEVPEISTEPAVSKLGEVYQLGRHRLMCGDSTKIEDVEKLMDGKKADMVFTDPPYGIDLDTDWNNTGRKHYREVIGDKEYFDISFLFNLGIENICLFGADYFMPVLATQKGTMMVWDKRVEEAKDKMKTSAFELLWINKKVQKVIFRKMWGSFLGGIERIQAVHPTQKPLSLLQEVMKHIKAENTILDLFGGSGSTLIACEQTNRICYMMEIDEKYCDVIRKRYAKFINKEAEWQTITPLI